MLLTAEPAGSDAADDEVHYSPPVHAPVTDPFRPPARPWRPGNRGVEYATEPGTPVRAAGEGTVTFAGLVAGALHVTVEHPDGIRTSYSFLAAVLVRVGDGVDHRVAVGVAGARLHVGARRGVTYLDPESLWGEQGPPWVRLVPLDDRGRRSWWRVGLWRGPGPRPGHGGRRRRRAGGAGQPAPTLVRRPGTSPVRKSPLSPVPPRSPPRGVRTG